MIYKFIIYPNYSDYESNNTSDESTSDFSSETDSDWICSDDDDHDYSKYYIKKR